MLRIWFIARAVDDDRVGARTVSSPPSVAVPPVRGHHVDAVLVGEGEHRRRRRRCCRTIATAAGVGIVYTPKMFCSLRKLSMLLLLGGRCVVGDDVLGAEDLLQMLDDGVSAQSPWWMFLCVVSVVLSGRSGTARSKSASVRPRMSW